MPDTMRAPGPQHAGEKFDRSRALFPFLSRRQTHQVAGIGLLWCVVTLLLAGAAQSLPVSTPNPWAGVVANAPPLARWDAGWYRSIALDGYSYEPAKPENNVAFYPLYSILTGSLSRSLHLPLFWVGIVFSLLCLVCALLPLADLFAQWGGGEAAIPGVAALLLFPTAYYFAAFYTESLFLLTTTAAIWGTRRHRYALAGLAGALACLTRLNGIFLMAPLLWLAWEGSGKNHRRLSSRPLAAAAAAAAGAVIYPLYLAIRFGDPLLYFHSHAITPGWPQHLEPFWALACREAVRTVHTIGHLGLGGKMGSLFNLGCATGFVVLTVPLFTRGLTAEGLYAGLTMLLLWSSGSLASVPRYVLGLFPCFFILAEFLRRRPVLAFAYALAGAGLGVVFLHRFVHWLFVA
jgi:Mannosyltransferase (PIG-V)